MTADVPVPAPRPTPIPRPIGAASPAPAEEPWGRVGDDGSVYVREAGGERLVGEYPDATPAEALAYFERKFTDLAAQVKLLEQRAERGAPPKDIAKAVDALRGAVHGANAVGDLAALERRLDALGGTITELTEQQSAEAAAALERARAEREAIVVEAETLAARDLSNVQWKQLSGQLDELFARWQAQQQNGPRLPKAEGDALWKRFRAARATIDTARKAFYAELDSAQRAARDRKRELIAAAEALAPRGADGIPQYRALLDEWKQVGRAGRRYDDALWASFKAAGDVLYQAKAGVVARAAGEEKQNLEAKLALLDEAAPILQLTEPADARRRLLEVQRRWDAIGRVPRDDARTVEGRIRDIETYVKRLEDEAWRRNNPETKARAEGLSSQLNSAIERLEAELAEARAAKNAKKVAEVEEALAARRIWLDAIR